MACRGYRFEFWFFSPLILQLIFKYYSCFNSSGANYINDVFTQKACVCLFQHTNCYFFTEGTCGKKCVNLTHTSDYGQTYLESNLTCKKRNFFCMPDVKPTQHTSMFPVLQFFQRGKLHFCLEFVLIVTSSDIHSWLKMRLMHV